MTTYKVQLTFIIKHSIQETQGKQGTVVVVGTVQRAVDVVQERTAEMETIITRLGW